MALAEDFLSGVWLEVEPGPGAMALFYWRGVWLEVEPIPVVMALFCRRGVWIFSLAPGHAFGAARFRLLRAAQCAVMAGELMAAG